MYCSLQTLNTIKTNPTRSNQFPTIVSTIINVSFPHIPYQLSQQNQNSNKIIYSRLLSQSAQFWCSFDIHNIYLTQYAKNLTQKFAHTSLILKFYLMKKYSCNENICKVLGKICESNRQKSYTGQKLNLQLKYYIYKKSLNKLPVISIILCKYRLNLTHIFLSHAQDQNYTYIKIQNKKVEKSKKSNSDLLSSGE
eukprot:TRINITY_DN3341_c0_g1_i2.p1 TRINITY_DN3341_c0_g1~~TRINITY_DN3341_c0_g1_i2.p1  ORF type:complete len:195 (-),score=-18.94 TRINITY_DN3341_c0_g1_i2:10-594(-)